METTGSRMGIWSIRSLICLFCEKKIWFDLSIKKLRLSISSSDPASVLRCCACEGDNFLAESVERDGGSEAASPQRDSSTDGSAASACRCSRVVVTGSAAPRIGSCWRWWRPTLRSSEDDRRRFRRGAFQRRRRRRRSSGRESVWVLDRIRYSTAEPERWNK